MVIKNPRTFVLHLILVLVVLLVSACGGDAPAEEALSVAVATPAATTASSDAESSTEPSESGSKMVIPEVDIEDADAAQPASPLGVAALSPLSAADTASHARAVASRRTLSVDEPAAGTGSVRGKLVVERPEMLLFLTSDLYLGSVVFSQGEISLPFVSMQLSRAPKATEKNDAGEFVFEDVEPGLYALVLYTAASQYIVPEPGGTDVLYLQVEAGEIIELDDLLVD